MAIQNKRIYGTNQILVASGTSALVASGALSAESSELTVGASTSGHADYPFGIFEGVFTGNSFSSNSEIHLFARLQQAGGTKAPAPTVTFRQDYMGSFKVLPQAAAQVRRIGDLEEIILPPRATYYIINEGGDQVDSGWTLNVTPWGYGT